MASTSGLISLENLNERQDGAAFAASDFPGLGDAISGKNLHG